MSLYSLFYIALFVKISKKWGIQMEKKVKEKGELLTTLLQLFPELSTKKVKNYLKGHSVLVNDRMITQYNYTVVKDDIIRIEKSNKTHKYAPLPIIYEDDEFLVVDKPSGLLSIATDKEREKTAYHMMREFVKRRGRGEKLFILHRLDRDTSGVLVFVKNENLKLSFQSNWNQLAKQKEYMAVVYGQLKDIDSYVCYLEEDKNYYVHVVDHGGKKSITSIQTLGSNSKYSLVKVSIKTGRKNQIRVVLAHLNHPIVGDKKYAEDYKKAARLFLHASKLVIKHPTKAKTHTFVSPLPSMFKQLVK